MTVSEDQASQLYQQIEEVHSQHEMDDEYKDKIQDILCNDCQAKSQVPYHFIYHQCSECKSYNTRLV